MYKKSVNNGKAGLKNALLLFCSWALTHSLFERTRSANYLRRDAYETVVSNFDLYFYFARMPGKRGDG
jgi:hypothetical protein